MKRLNIFHAESSLGLGGQERAVLLHAQGLQKRSHRIRLLLVPDSPIYSMACTKQLPVEPIRRLTTNILRGTSRLMVESCGP